LKQAGPCRSQVASVLAHTRTSILTVAEVTAYIKRLLDRDEVLSDIVVRGEVSNLRRPSSGHIYFSLKDEQSVLDAVCFRGNAASLGFEVEDGMQVVAGGNVTVYEPQGRYQIVVRFMRPDGAGALAAAFEKLKSKLEAEGLFAEDRKRPLPRFPRTIALITSGSGAAVRDMISIISSRYPLVRIKLIPTPVQGAEAAGSLVNSLAVANAADVDLIVIGRGGGSLEDLWPFNEEPVARAVFASRAPVISAVGHETDYVLTDFVADARAATPSHAAEMAVPDARELLGYLKSASSIVLMQLRKLIHEYRSRLRGTTAHPLLLRPGLLVDNKLQELDDLSRALWLRAGRLTQNRRARLDKMEARLAGLDPNAVLRRGYSIVRRADDGRLVTTVGSVGRGDRLTIAVSDGEIAAEVGGVQAASAPIA